jgi:SAM-dependent methyltransferase
MNPTDEALQELYRSGERVRAARLTAATVELVYRPYVEFVRAFTPAGRLLDVGCGAGWSTSLFAAHGYDATGVDLNPRAFEPAPAERLRFVEGSATALPFPDASFDIVAAHRALEHVPDPAAMLGEMVRMTRAGGLVAVVGPNLLSVGLSLRTLGLYVWRNRPPRTILVRSAAMPRHPFGNTLPEAVAALARNLLRIARKSLARRADFTMRVPDLRPPFTADNDAVYLCNPLDLRRYFRERGCVVLRDVALGRGGWTRMLAGGTWVAARTPERRVG